MAITLEKLSQVKLFHDLNQVILFLGDNFLMGLTLETSTTKLLEALETPTVRLNDTLSNHDCTVGPWVRLFISSEVSMAHL